MATPNQPQTSKQYFQSLLIIYFALLAGQLMFAVIAYFISSSNGGLGETDADFVQIGQIMVAVLAVTNLIISTQISKALVSKAKDKNTLKEKLAGYRSALIVKYALLEGASMFASVFLLLTGEIFFFIVAVLIIGVFLLYRPSKEKTIAELQLHYTEVEKLEDENAMVI